MAGLTLLTLGAACGGDGGTEPLGTGAIHITTTTGGAVADPDGYTVTLDGSVEGAVPTTGTLTLDAVAAGDHSVELGDVPEGCTMEGDNPREVRVAAGETEDVGFALTCDGPGALEVTTVTRGEYHDPNGYFLTIDGGPPVPLLANGTALFPDLSPSTHALALRDVALNCRVQGGGTRRNVEAAVADTVRVTFDVACSSGPLILDVRGPAVVTNGPGDVAAITVEWADPDGDIDSLVTTLLSDPVGVLDESGLAEGDSTTVPLSYPGQTRGSTVFPLSCEGCEIGPVTLAYTLVDARGNRSNRGTVSFAVAEAAPGARVSRSGRVVR